MSVSTECITDIIMHSIHQKLMSKWSCFFRLINISLYLLFILGVALGPLLFLMHPQTSESINIDQYRGWKLVVRYRSVNDMEIAFTHTVETGSGSTVSMKWLSASGLIMSCKVFAPLNVLQKITACVQQPTSIKVLSIMMRCLGTCQRISLFLGEMNGTPISSPSQYLFLWTSSNNLQWDLQYTFGNVLVDEQRCRHSDFGLSVTGYVSSLLKQCYSSCGFSKT